VVAVTVAVVMPPPLPGVAIVLDTTPPRLTLTGAPVATPPEDWAVVIGVDEGLVALSGVFTDPTGPVPVGLPPPPGAAATLTATIPTSGLTGGQGELEVRAIDLAGNLAVARLPVAISRPLPYLATLTIGPAYGTDASFPPPYEAVVSVVAAYAVALQIEALE